ncbi:calmodulin 5 [Brachionus plicatilis]|uniref:Calmodulin 5 n=1 Tax=Brachionus plicatilis TaxID=10195 RepID=A0A3M7SQS4_BRAPC|nr:calmodulin 5 [Brachionus plicatilis]
MNQLESNEIKDLRSAFRMIDLEKSGKICIHDLKNLVKNLNLNVDKQVVDSVFENIDQNGDGKIQFEEFLSEIEKRQSKKSHIETAFSAIDLDSSGYITVDELSKIAKKINVTITKQQIEEIMSKTDLDGNHKISLDEFKTLMEE